MRRYISGEICSGLKSGLMSKSSHNLLTKFLSFKELSKLLEIVFLRLMNNCFATLKALMAATRSTFWSTLIAKTEELHLGAG